MTRTDSTEPLRTADDAVQEDFAVACRQAVGALRAGLINLYDDIGADPSRPQDVARRFDLNKNLTWKVARLIQAEDGLDAVAFIPGPGALEILLDAAERSGASTQSLENARSAIEIFNEMVRIHAGDRSDLELLLDASSDRPLAMSRRLGFRSNAGVWGLQARTRVSAHFLAPASVEGRLDTAIVAGLIDVRRLRSIQRWPLFRFARYNDDSSMFHDRRQCEPIVPVEGRAAESAGEHWAWLLPQWSSPNLPALHAVEEDEAILYQLGDGPVGRTGQFTCFFGYLDRAGVPRYRDAHNHRAELSSTVSLPMENLVYDVFIHRTLTETQTLQATLYGRPSGTLATSLDERERQRLPMAERVADLGGPLQCATPLVPHWDELVRHVFRRAGWDPREFIAKRLVLEHPPMPSTVMFHYELPAAPRP